MASTPFINHSAENGGKDLYLECAIGATGAVGTVVRQNGFGAAYPASARSLASIVRNSAGNYTLNLDQRWQAMIEFDVNCVGVVAPTDGFDYYIVSRNLNQAQPTIVFQMVQASGAAADPFAGAAAGNLLVHVTLKDSTV
jgi:hypothetical protein